MLNFLDRNLIKASCKFHQLKNQILFDENGDTNFISIIIILGIVLALCVVFRDYITKILGKIKGSVENFNNDAF